jgi:hypothetical protein
MPQPALPEDAGQTAFDFAGARPEEARCRPGGAGPVERDRWSGTGPGWVEKLPWRTD